MQGLQPSPCLIGLLFYEEIPCHRAGNVSVCLHALRERESLKAGERVLKRQREVCVSLLTLYKLDSGTSGTSQ